MAALPPVRVVRPRDLLVLDFEFDNLKLADERGPTLVRDGPGRALIHVLFGAQALVERAFPMTTEGLPLKTKAAIAERKQPIAATLAGPTRLSFIVPADVGITFSVDGLLRAMRTLDLHVVRAASAPERGARPGSGGTPRSFAERLFAGSASGAEPTRAAITGRHQLVRTTANLAGRFGVSAAIESVAAASTEPLLGPVRVDVLPTAPIKIDAGAGPHKAVERCEDRDRVALPPPALAAI